MARLDGVKLGLGVWIWAIIAAILVALLGALVGGAVGTRYHRKVDAVGFEDVTVPRVVAFPVEFPVPGPRVRFRHS